MDNKENSVYIEEGNNELKFKTEEEFYFPEWYSPSILKSNCLIQAIWFKTGTQVKLYNVFHAVAFEKTKENPEQKDFTLTLREVIEYAWIKKKDLKEIKKIILDLQKQRIQYDIFNKNSDLVWFWFTTVLQYVDVIVWKNEKITENSVVYFSFSDRVLNTIIKPRNNGGYTKLNILAMSDLNDLYSCILYQYLKMNKYLIDAGKKRNIDIDYFRKITNTEDKYPKTWNLIEKVLEQAVNSINTKNTDIIVSRTPIKAKWGKIITWFSFDIKENKNFKLKDFKDKKRIKVKETEANKEILEEIYKERNNSIWNIIEQMEAIPEEINEIDYLTEGELSKEAENQNIIKTFNLLYEKWGKEGIKDKDLKAFENLVNRKEKLSNGEILTLDKIKERALNYIEYCDEEDEKFIKYKGEKYNRKTIFNRIEKNVYIQDLKPSKKKLISKETKKNFKFSEEGEQMSLF